MSFESVNYLHLAQELANMPPTIPTTEEAKLRSAISRAYYSIFLKARDFLEENGFADIRHDGSDHLTVKNTFKTHYDGKWKKIGFSLEALLQHRTEADYGDTIKGLPNVTALDINRAEITMVWLDELEIKIKSNQINGARGPPTYRASFQSSLTSIIP